jgi:two-component system, NarL family, sensor histidine kinase UhpB
VAAYRIVQESLTNVARHARTDAAEVQLHADHERLQVRVRDAGRGFVPAETLRGPSLGLVGMRERCLALGGRLSIESSRGAGTTVLAELPWGAPREEAAP